MNKHLTALLLSMLIMTSVNAQQWVRNESRPTSFKQGLEGRHIAVWASHGRYYDLQKGSWQWQRPNLFGTNEDLFSQTFTIPYLIPMLEKAGAVVWTPRERDWQPREIIVDNDMPSSGYTEDQKWKSTQKGFALHSGNYNDGENPFEAGSARMHKTTKKPKKTAVAIYRPQIREVGDYAVYISYQTLKKSTNSARYIVRHQGIDTHFDVNQKVGGGTWVYLGTFRFDANKPSDNCITLLTYTPAKGIVTTDAIRLGGGMGNIERGGTTSGLPRFAEGARYWAQWAGAPRWVVSHSNGQNDYNDDINCRSLMENWLAGGSTALPDSVGLGVPFDLSLAMHTDAGNKADDSYFGTLNIVTTDNEGRNKLGDNRSRTVSKTLAEEMVQQVTHDLSQTFNTQWTSRSVWDKNYSESRRPEVPSTILEMLSHQNFSDMRMAHDPNFKFTLSRAVYKTIARFIARENNQAVAIAPLAPHAFRISMKNGKATLSWDATYDPLESTATPLAYNVYTKGGNLGFDNGQNVKRSNYSIVQPPSGKVYSFKVTATNTGGESFPTETLALCQEKDAKKSVLVINGFRRLAAPQVIDNYAQKGFDLDSDPGVSYMRTAGWAGRQTCFDASQTGKEGPGALGYGGSELAGQVIAGNTFDYAAAHVEDIAAAHRYNVVSCSVEAVEQGLVSLSDYDCVDLILGLEKDDHYSLLSYSTFSPTLQRLLTDYTTHGGSLLVSGSYIGSDGVNNNGLQTFHTDILKISYNGTLTANNAASITGLGKTFDIYTSLNAEHYAATHPESLSSTDGSFSAMKYSNNQSAAVAYAGKDYKSFTMGFPFECIKDKATRQAIMRGILQFLMP